MSRLNRCFACDSLGHQGKTCPQRNAIRTRREYFCHLNFTSTTIVLFDTTNPNRWAEIGPDEFCIARQRWSCNKPDQIEEREIEPVRFCVDVEIRPKRVSE